MVSNNSEIVETIRAGGKLEETVEILYKASNGSIITTETEPYEIRNGVYVCWCGLRKRLVEIVLSNVIDAVLTGNTYSPRFHSSSFDD